MNDMVAVALIAATPPTLAALLSFLSNRSVKRQVATTGDLPIGPLVERLEVRVESILSSVDEINRRVGRLEGRTTMPLRLARRLDALGDGVNGLAERIARLEAKETGA